VGGGEERDRLRRHLLCFPRSHVQSTLFGSSNGLESLDSGLSEGIGDGDGQFLAIGEVLEGLFELEANGGITGTTLVLEVLRVDGEVRSGVVLLVEELENSIISDIKAGIVGFGDNDFQHIVGGGLELLVFLSGEDINTNEFDLGVTVLSGLGSSHFHDLARLALKKNARTLSEGGSLERLSTRDNFFFTGSRSHGLSVGR